LSSSPLEDKHSPFGLLPARQRHYASINPQEFGPFRINDNRELVLVDLNLSPQELLPGVFKEHLQEMFRLYRGQAPPQLKFKIRITPDTGAFDYNSQLCRRLIEFIPALGNQEYPFLNIHPCLIYFLEEGTHDSMLILQNIIYRIYGLNAEEAENTFIDYLCQSLIGNISLECITNQGFNKHIIVEDQWIERFIQQKFVFLMQQYDNYERGTQIYSWFKANRVNPDFTGYFIQQVEKHLKEAPAPEGIGTIHMLAWLLSMPELLGPVKNCENWNNSSFSNILQHGRPKLTQDQVNNYILDTLNAVVDKDLRNLGRACLQCLRNFTEFSAEDLSWVVGNFEVEIDDYLRKLATEEGYARRDDELWKWVLEHKDNPEAAAKVKELLNDYITVVGEGNEEEKKKEAQMVLSKPQIEFLVNNLIMSQEVGLPAGGLTIDFWWARTYKKEVLLSLKDILEHCSIYSFQMEHCVERSFMEDLKQSLIRSGIGEYKAQKLTQRFAMLMMAGGLGSFKPDLTRSEHEVLKSILGEEWAKEHFAVCGVFYSKFIRGFKKPGEEVEEEVVNEAIKLFGDPVKTVEIKLEKDAVDYFGLKNEVVIAGIFKEKHLPVSQYWLVCPEIYLEIYPGENNDKWRALQSIIYREAYLRFIKEREEGKRNSLIFTMSEVNTTLVFPWVVEDKHKYDPLFAPENVSVHHYNHTIVLAGMAFYEEALFKILKISQEYNDCIVWKDELGRKIVDMAKLTARALKKNNNAWNFITGCSDIHTQKLKEEIFKDFRDLVRQDNLWRNTEGAVSKRWMGDEVRKVVNKYMKILGLREDCEEDYDLLKFYLDNDENQQVKFIEELLTAKRIQKKRFIEELKKKTFGDTGLTDEELDALIDRAFIAGARRLVDYKCADLILELLENNEAFRQRFVAAKPVLFTGGREFGEFGKKVRERAERLMSDPYLGLKGSLIFIAEHDIFTSWIIQQGADVGMIIAWKFKEAAAQSYADLMQDGGIIFVIFGAGPKERLGRIVISKDKRFEEGIKHVSKVGIIIEFNSFLSEIDDGFGNKSYERLPNPDSFIEGIEEISRLYSQYRDYSQQDSYGQWSYRSLMIGLTIGEERHQTAGIINLWAKAEKIRKREAVKGADASSAALIQKLNNSTSLISSKDLAHSPSGKDCSSPAAKILRTKAIGSPVIFPAKDEEIKAKISANPGYLGLGTVLKLSAGDKLEEAAFSLAPQGAPQEIIELKIREEKAYFRQILSELELSIGNGRVSELKREIFEEICQKKLQAYAFFEQTAKRLNLPAEDKSKIEDRLKQRYELNEVSIKSEEGKFIQILEPLLKEIDKGKIDLGSIGRSVMLKAPEIKENIRKERLPLYLCFYEAIKFYRIASPETKGILYDLVCNFRKSKEFDKNNRQEAGVYVNYFRHWADTIIEGDESLQLKAEIIKKINQGLYPDAAINLAIGGKRIEAHQRRLFDFLSFLLQGKFQDPEKIISRIQEKRGIVLAAQSLNWLQVKEYREALHLVGILSERDPGKAHWLTFTKDIPILLQGEFSFLNTGDYVAVDGEKSVVVTNLKRDTLRRYRKQIEDRLALDEIYDQRLSEPLPKNIEVKVNVGAEIEKESLLYEKLGRPLVGLVRTELLYEYLMPTLKKLVEWLSWFPGRIRLLDYQEDKDLKAFASFGQGYGLKFLLSSRGKLVLRKLLKAILLVYKVDKKTSFFIPMVNKVKEIKEVKKVFRGVKKELIAFGEIDRKDAAGLKIGVMIETKEAVKKLESIVKQADYFSIGTNDLIDRQDIPFEQGVKIVEKIVEQAARAGKDVSICGNWAARYEFIVYAYKNFISKGKKVELSVPLANFAKIKEFIRNVEPFLEEIEEGGCREGVLKGIAAKISQHMESKLRKTAEYKNAIKQRHLNYFLRKVTEESFSTGLDPQILNVSVGKIKELVPAAREEEVSPQEVPLGEDYAFLGSIGRLIAYSLRYRSRNSNRLNIFRFLVGITNWIRKDLGSSLDNQLVVSGCQMPWKRTPGLSLGEVLGEGSKIKGVFGLLEVSEGLINPKKIGTVLGAMIAKEIKTLPETYFFKIAAAKEGIDSLLAEIIAKYWGKEDFYSRVADDVKGALEEKNSRAAILFRPRHKELIRAFAGEGFSSEEWEREWKRLEKKVKGSDGRYWYKNVLLLEGDDWSEGLKMGMSEGVSLIIGVGGAREALMSAGLMRKRRGSFAGFIVAQTGRLPWQEKEPFSPKEKEVFKKFDINPHHIFITQELVPVRALDILIFAGMIREYPWSKEITIPEPKIDQEGNLLCHILMVDIDGAIIDVPLLYETKIKKLLGSKKREDLIELALSWSEFGEYKKALDILAGLARVCSGEQEQRISAIQYYIRALGDIKSIEENANAKAIKNLAEAVRVNRENELGLEEQLHLSRRLRRIFVWLRQEAKSTGDYQKAIEFCQLLLGEKDLSMIPEKALWSQKGISKVQEKLAEQGHAAAKFRMILEKTKAVLVSSSPVKKISSPYVVNASSSILQPHRSGEFLKGYQAGGRAVGEKEIKRVEKEIKQELEALRKEGLNIKGWIAHYGRLSRLYKELIDRREEINLPVNEKLIELALHCEMTHQRLVDGRRSYSEKDGVMGIAYPRGDYPRGELPGALDEEGRLKKNMMIVFTPATLKKISIPFGNGKGIIATGPAHIWIVGQFIVDINAYRKTFGLEEISDEEIIILHREGIRIIVKKGQDRVVVDPTIGAMKIEREWGEPKPDMAIRAVEVKRILSKFISKDKIAVALSETLIKIMKKEEGLWEIVHPRLTLEEIKEKIEQAFRQTPAGNHYYLGSDESKFFTIGGVRNILKVFNDPLKFKQMLEELSGSMVDIFGLHLHKFKEKIQRLVEQGRYSFKDTESKEKILAKEGRDFLQAVFKDVYNSINENDIEVIDESSTQAKGWRNEKRKEKMSGKAVTLFTEGIQESVRPWLEEDMYFEKEGRRCWRRGEDEKLRRWAVELESWLDRIGLEGAKKQVLKNDPSFFGNIEWVNEPGVKEIVRGVLKEKFGLAGPINIGRVSSFKEEKEPGKKIIADRYIILARKSKESEEEKMFFMRLKLPTQEPGLFFDGDMEGSWVMSELLGEDTEIVCPSVDRLVVKGSLVTSELLGEDKEKLIFYLREFVSGKYKIDPEELEPEKAKELARLFGRAAAIKQILGMNEIGRGDEVFNLALGKLFLTHQTKTFEFAKCGRIKVFSEFIVEFLDMLIEEGIYLSEEEREEIINIYLKAFSQEYTRIKNLYKE
ncbi:MAG: glycogen/starch/alpha-glucan phosphorylase, partial [Candidatus Omnitrophica bacterium]|nr:glycogen/starch/alpha-glucan phosphorylase [Candidatus Omnitrophota bacterium]